MDALEVRWDGARRLFLVRNQGRLPTHREHEELLREMRRHLEGVREHAVVFDARACPAPDREARELWVGLSRAFPRPRRLAVIQAASAASRVLEAVGSAGGLPVAFFPDEDAAAAWAGA